MKIKKGDKVEVVTGEDKGRTGIVKKVLSKSGQLIVEGINVAKKHLKASKGQKGGIIDLEVPLFQNKVMLVCSQCGKRTRVGYQLDKGGKKYRICRKCQSLLDSRVQNKKK